MLCQLKAGSNRIEQTRLPPAGGPRVMRPLSQPQGRAQRRRPATDPLMWVSSIELSDDELLHLKQHVERLLNLDEVEVQQEVSS